MNLPSDPSKRKKIKEALVEAEKIMFLQDTNKVALKDISDRMKEELDIKPSDFNKWVKVWFDEAKANDQVADMEESISEVEILKGTK